MLELLLHIFAEELPVFPRFPELALHIFARFPELALRIFARFPELALRILLPAVAVPGVNAAQERHRRR